MRVALISFEYPPSLAVGGIGTYTREAVLMLAEAGHSVEVFAAGREAGSAPGPRGALIHRVAAANRAGFPAALVPLLRERHAASGFDVIEAPEIGPEGAPAFVAIPEAARVVKLHTPAFLVARTGYDPPPLSSRIRFTLAGMCRGRWQTLGAPSYLRERDPEFQAAQWADEYAAPTRAIADVLRVEWSLPPQRISVFPFPFSPPPALLALPPPERVNTIGFLGRLEARKGVPELFYALREVLRQAPSLRCRLIGPSWPYAGSDMRSWALREMPEIARALEFKGAIRPEQVPAELGSCDLLVLPSRWESFGFTCAEGMAGARAVIGSAAGGMAEMVEPGVSGLLVPPRDPGALAAAILSLVRHPERVRALGSAARRRILSLLSPDRVLPQQLASYERAIAQRAQRAHSR